jgi:hypothetical protein
MNNVLSYPDNKEADMCAPCIKRSGMLHDASSIHMHCCSCVSTTSLVDAINAVATRFKATGDDHGCPRLTVYC